MRVVVAVCCNAQGEVLLAQRKASAHLGGSWEFPGGKVEPDETDAHALWRELHEEVGLCLPAHEPAPALTPLLTRQFAYPDRTLTIQAYTVLLDAAQCATLHGAEGQVLRWLHPQAMATLATPAANAPLLAALCWPAYWHITPNTCDVQQVMAWLSARCQPDELTSQPTPTHASLTTQTPPAARCSFRRHGVVLRLPQLSLAQYVAVAQQALALTSATGWPLLVHGHLAACAELAAFGFHASAQQAAQWQQQGLCKADILPTGYHLAVATHTADELATAAALQADWAWLSPVLPTPSHPEAAALGWAHWATLAQQSVLPVYALGGLEITLLDTARAQGAVGVAGISGF